MNLDEVIAANVRRLREERDLPKTQLAARLRMGRHRVYDFERPRRGAQHSFTWSELVALCAALECSIFELVLPAEGETVDVPEWVAHGGLEVPGVEIDLEEVDPEHIDRGPEFGVVRVNPPGRDELAQIVFHMPAKAFDSVIEGEIGERFEAWRNRVRAAEIEAARKAQQTMVEALRAALADMEGDEG